MMKLNIQLFANSYVNPSYGKNEWGGTYSEHTAKRYKWRIYTKIKEQDTVNNKTTLAVGFYQTGTWGSYYGMNSTYSEIDYRIKGDDGTWSDWKQLVREKTPDFTKKDDVDTWDKKVGKDLTISHKADGTSRYFQIRGLNDSGNTTSYAPYSITVTSDYLYVPTIPRESKFASDPTISNNKIQFDYTKYTTSFTDSVTISCYGTNLFEPFKPTDAVGTITVQKDLTQSNIDTIVQKANANNVTSVPIVITSITKDGNGNPIGATQSKTIYYNLIASTINSIAFSISNSAISLLPSFTPISSSNLKHKIKLTYLVGNTQYDTTPAVVTNLESFFLDSEDVARLFSKLATKTSSALVTFTLYTYLNSSEILIGTVTKDISYSLPAYTITGNISAEEGNTISGITKASTTFIRYLSKMNLTFSAKKASDNATSFYGRTIKYKIGTVNVTSPYSHNYDGTVPTVIAYTDLGDNLSLDVTGCNYVAYQYPICNINAYRSDAQGHAMQTGNCVKFEITITYFKEQTQSHLITQYAYEAPEFTLTYKEDGDPATSSTSFTQSGIEPITTISNNIVTATYTKIVGNMNYEKQLNYTLSGSDCVNQSIEIELGTVLPGRPGIYGYKKAGDNYTGINDHLILSNRTGKNILEVSSSNNSKYTNTIPAKSGTFAMTDDITSYHDSTKQDKLVSGTNIATVNNHDLLSGGNIEISGGSATNVKINGTSITSDGIADIKTNGTYNASSNKIATMSDIPSINNATLTIQKNGVDVQTFTANSATNKTANITVPTKTSDLTNDDNVVKDASYVHTDNNYTTTEKNKLSGIASGAEVNVQSDWNQSDNTKDDYIKNKPTLSTVATSGSYNDLSNKPTIPTVNNATLTIQKNGTTVNTFTANASSNVTANITVPTKTSDLTNDDNVVKDASYVHTDNNYTTTEKNKLSGIASGAEVNVQSNWNETNTSSDAYIQNKPTIPTVNNGTLTIQKNGTNVQTFTANQSSNATANITVPTKTSDLSNDSNFITNSGSTTGNAGSATKLETARTIGIGTGATGTATSFNGTANITIPITDVKEAYTTWGGKNISGDVTAVDMGCVDEFGHNKLAYLPAGCIKVEYTNDGGTTWLDYGLTDAQKIAAVTTSGSPIIIGKGTVSASGGTLTTANMGNYKVRVTISTRNGTGQTSGALYTQAKKLLINMSNNGATCKCLIENRTIANYNNNANTWTTHGTYDVSGWSGWNSIPYSIKFGGSSTQTSQIADLRITLYLTGINTAYSCAAQLIDFRLIGSTNWSMPSEMARAGHLYKVDTDKRAIFPYDIRPETNNVGTLGTSSYKWNNVYATTFNGALSGTASFTGNVNFNKNEAQNFAVQRLSTAPASPVNGQLYYDTNYGTVYVYANGGWVDILATSEPTENYNQLFNRPITNLEGTSTEPLILANLSHGTYRIMGEYKYDSSDTTKSTDGALVLVFGSDSETRRIIFGEGGVIIGNGTIENGKFKSLLPIVTTSSMTANSTVINGWKTELIDGVLVEYYGG